MQATEARIARRGSDGIALAGLVLRNQAAWRALGEWESRLLANRLAAVPIDRPVFITGLARSGTTILLRKICELPEFVSHRYADFPFLFTPYGWSRLLRLAPARRRPPRERMHRDGIMVTQDSPEAMEELLWMAFFPDLHDPGRSNLLDERVERRDFESFLADHIRKLILARGGRRYVSKNNYNVSRLSYLARVFPDARFLLPVRGPLAHVASLMKQHDLFCQVQRDSETARRQLRLRGHFEFGLDRRPINPGDQNAIAEIEDCWARGEEARGWAKYWAVVYGHVMDRLATDTGLSGRCLVVRYEDLCDRSAQTMAAVCAHIGLAAAWADRLADGLRQPDYYVPRFTDGERSAIAEETFAVSRHLGYAAE
jgi:hypothetical protein